MSVITQIAIRKLINDKKKNLVLMAAVTVSMALCSFFVLFKTQTEMYPSPYSGTDFDDYLNKFSLCMDVVMAFLIVTTFVTLNTYCTLLTDENRKPLAVLSTVGATGFQKRSLMLSQLTVLFLPSIFVGGIIGSLFGILTGKVYMGVDIFTPFDIEVFISNIIACIGSMAVGIVIILGGYLASVVKSRHTSVIQNVNIHNTEAASTRHGYRNSNTYKRQPFMKRLAKKSTDYYLGNYNAISQNFAVAVLYPLVSVYMIYSMLKYDVGIAEAVSPIISVVVFLIVAFVLLSGLGVGMAVMASKLQIEIRSRSIKIYKSIGMTEDELKNLMYHELKSIILRSAVYVIFAFSTVYILCQKILYPDMPLFILTPKKLLIILIICLGVFIVTKLFKPKEY